MRRLPTLKASKVTWYVTPLVGCYHSHPPLPSIIITHLEADTHFIVVQKVEG